MEGSMKELYLMRHGKTQENIAHILMGQIDSPLCDETRVDILSIKPYVVKPDQILSSDLKRTIETARMLFPSQEVTQLPQLRERHFGRFQGYPYQALEKKGLKGKAWYQLDGDEGVYKNSGAETLSSVTARANHVLNLIEGIDSKTILVMGHGGYNSYMVNILLNERLILHPLENLHFHYCLLKGRRDVIEAKFDQSWLDTS